MDGKVGLRSPSAQPPIQRGLPGEQRAAPCPRFVQDDHRTPLPFAVTQTVPKDSLSIPLNVTSLM